jgi:hypothetical protein
MQFFPKSIHQTGVQDIGLNVSKPFKSLAKRMYTGFVHTTKPCGSWLASDGVRSANNDGG